MKKSIFKVIDTTIILSILYLTYYYMKEIIILLVVTVAIYFVINVSLSFMFKNRLNYLYTFKYDKKDNKYELQYNPRFAFHWINKNKLIEHSLNAIHKLKSKIENPNIIGVTMTLNQLNKNMTLIKEYSSIHFLYYQMHY